MKNLQIFFLLTIFNVNLLMHTGQANNINELPQEIQLMILSSIIDRSPTLKKAADDIKSAMLTQKQWRDYLQNIAFVDVLIRKLVNQYDRSTHEVINALGNEITHDLIKACRHFIENSTFENAQEIPIYSCFYLVVPDKQIELINYLQNNKIPFDINMTREYGITLLMDAVINKNINLIQYLLQQPKINLNKKDKAGVTAYVYVKFKNSPEITALFPQQAEQQWEQFAQHLATELFPNQPEQAAILKESLIENPNINDARTTEGHTLLSLAAENCNLNIIQMLLNAGAHVDAKIMIIEPNEDLPDGLQLSTQPPLVLATKNNCTEVVKLLIKAGANVHESLDEEIDGDEEIIYSPLTEAIKNYNYEIVEILLNKGASIEYYGLYPFIEAKNDKMIQLLIEKSNQRDKRLNLENQINYALRHATKNNDITKVDMLLRRGQSESTPISRAKAYLFVKWNKFRGY